jgi:undecaprenyl-diphosphatase
VFVVLGVAARADMVFAWDGRLHDWLRSFSEPDEFSPVADDAIGLLVRIGADLIILTVILASVYVLAIRRRFRETGFLLASIAGAVALTYLLKDVFERDPLSEYGKYEVPSGHAARSLTAVGALVAVTWTTRWRWWAASAGALFVATLGVSLVYENWHLPSDVLGGWSLAVAVLTTAWAALFVRGTVRR